MEVKDLKQDAHNYRKHSKENKRKIKKSIDECGYGRSVVVDADGVLIAGNGVHSVTDENTKVRVIETDGTELVVVKRTDLHEGDEKRKKLAAADNATADNVEWDFSNLLDDFDMPELEDMGIKLPKDEQDEEGDVQFSEMLNEENNYIVIQFKNSIDWLQALDFFHLEMKKSRSSIKSNGEENKNMRHYGIGRVVDGADVMEKIRKDFEK